MSLPTRAISMANAEVNKTLSRASDSKKRGSYRKYSPKTRAAIGMYASMNGVSATSRLYSRKLKNNVSTSTVLSIKKSFVEERKTRQENDEPYDEITELPVKPRGRPLLLGKLDQKVQCYLKKVRESGGVVNSRIVRSAAKGLVSYFNPSILVENGGHVDLSQNWALSLLERMNYVKKKGTTAKSKESDANFKKRKEEFLREVFISVELENIPVELILNWDQTGIKIVPSSNWTMELSSSKRVEILGASDKRQITAVLCGTLLGDILPTQVIYQGQTDRCHPR